jgi:hypothetical protein
MSRRARMLRSMGRGVVARALLLVMAVAFVFAVYRGGTRYFYCPITHLSFDESPCAPNSDDALRDEKRDETPTVRGGDCCVQKWRPTAPQAAPTIVDEPDVGRAAVAASLPAPPPGLTTANAKVPFVVAYEVRAGPPPPSAREKRAQLSVFHL